MGIRQLFAGDDSRTIKAKKNIYISFGIKAADTFMYLLLVPLTLGYLNEYEYGIWLTINSILMWINSFDIGLGNGLRNKLAEALAKDDKQLCKEYVSTTIIMLLFIMLLLLFGGLLISCFIDWYNVLGVSQSAVEDLDQIIFVSYGFFCLNFVLKIIGSIYLALQLSAVNNLFTCLSHAIALLAIFILTKTTDGSLMYVAIAYSAAAPLAYLLAFPFTFLGKYSFMSPSLTCFRKKLLGSLFSMSILFFVIQLGSLLLFSTANLIISHMFGPDKVTPYNIAYKYFSLITIAISLIIVPMWSATTDAYASGDMEWIKITIRKINKMLCACLLTMFCMVAISPLVYSVWIGNTIVIPFKMTVLVAMYIYVLLFSMTYSYFLNGMGFLMIQSINTVIVGILFIPMSICLGKIIGLYGVIVALLLANVSGALLNYIQFNKIIFGTAKGIWLK